MIHHTFALSNVTMVRLIHNRTGHLALPVICQSDKRVGLKRATPTVARLMPQLLGFFNSDSHFNTIEGAAVDGQNIFHYCRVPKLRNQCCRNSVHLLQDYSLKIRIVVMGLFIFVLYFVSFWMRYIYTRTVESSQSQEPQEI